MMKSMANHGVFMILFVCISITFIGIACDENTRESETITSHSQTEGIERYLSDLGRAMYTESRHGQYNSDAIALWMIEKHLGEIVELMKEAKQP